MFAHWLVDRPVNAWMEAGEDPVLHGESRAGDLIDLFPKSPVRARSWRTRSSQRSRTSWACRADRGTRRTTRRAGWSRGTRRNTSIPGDRSPLIPVADTGRTARPFPGDHSCGPPGEGGRREKNSPQTFSDGTSPHRRPLGRLQAGLCQDTPGGEDTFQGNDSRIVEVVFHGARDTHNLLRWKQVP